MPVPSEVPAHSAEDLTQIPSPQVTRPPTPGNRKRTQQQFYQPTKLPPGLQPAQLTPQSLAPQSLAPQSLAPEPLTPAPLSPTARKNGSNSMPKSLPYGVQVLKRLHDDAAGLLHEYDDFAENTDNQAVKFLLTSLCVQHKKNLDEIARVWHSHPHTKALPRPMGMDALPPPDEYEMEDIDARHRRGLQAGEAGSDEYMDALLRDDEDENDENFDGQGMMQGLGTQLGGDNPLPMGDEQFHKALVATADFLKSLVKAARSDSAYGPHGLGGLADVQRAGLHGAPERATAPGSQDVAESDIGYGDETDMPSPLARKSKKTFSKSMQGEARRQAGELEQYNTANQVNDLDIQSEINDVIRLLRSLGESREPSGSEDPLNDAELSALDKGEKSLRSLVSGKRGRFPRMKHRGRKSLEGTGSHLEARVQGIQESSHERAKEIDALQESIQKLTKMMV